MVDVLEIVDVMLVVAVVEGVHETDGVRVGCMDDVAELVGATLALQYPTSRTDWAAAIEPDAAFTSLFDAEKPMDRRFEPKKSSSTIGNDTVLTLPMGFKLRT